MLSLSPIRLFASLLAAFLLSSAFQEEPGTLTLSHLRDFPLLLDSKTRRVSNFLLATGVFFAVSAPARRLRHIF